MFNIFIEIQFKHTKHFVHKQSNGFECTAHVYSAFLIILIVSEGQIRTSIRIQQHSPTQTKQNGLKKKKNHNFYEKAIHLIFATIS